MKLLSLIKERIMFSKRLYWLLETNKIAIYGTIAVVFLNAYFFQKYSINREMSLELFIITMTLFFVFCLFILLVSKSPNYDKSYLSCEKETIEFINIFNNSIKERLDKKFPNIRISVFEVNAFENKKMTFALVQCEKYYRKGKIDKNLFKKTKDFYVEYFSKLFSKYEKSLREYRTNQSNLQNSQMKISNILKAK
ncbi:hypothetical protein [Campylobacter sp. US33a]|uniref:hypothetical protein n=1 Tax=Campylobacter sp. US33a TaxID=2498120 RepID=UPI001067AE75|nr:hypothetical protein [Campylobacter sp. US33a]TEY00696.1 hypothetical protein ELQ16_08660 [Campylobacter sp. US33a]